MYKRQVYECANGFGAEAVVAVGGGSVMDMSKMIAACLTNPDYAKDVQKTEAVSYTHLDVYKRQIWDQFPVAAHWDKRQRRVFDVEFVRFRPQ